MMTILQPHEDNFNDPHNLTLAQLGLDQIKTFPLATEQEIIDLTRDDVYIGSGKETTIAHAFDNYLTSLGILVDGAIAKSITGGYATITFIHRKGAFHLNGTHEVAKYAQVTLILNDIELYIGEQFEIPENGYWTYDLNELGIHAGEPYRVNVTYLNAEMEAIGSMSDTLHTVEDGAGYLYTDEFGYMWYDQGIMNHLRQSDSVRYFDFGKLGDIVP